jgi:hypothetical protein
VAFGSVAGLACGRFFGNLAIAASLFQIAEKDLPALRQQLKAAEKAADNPAIVELSRRIVYADPKAELRTRALGQLKTAAGLIARAGVIEQKFKIE